LVNILSTMYFLVPHEHNCTTFSYWKHGFKFSVSISAACRKESCPSEESNSKILQNIYFVWVRPSSCQTFKNILSQLIATSLYSFFWSQTPFKWRNLVPQHQLIGRNTHKANGWMCFQSSKSIYLFLRCSIFITSIDVLFLNEVPGGEKLSFKHVHYETQLQTFWSEKREIAPGEK